MKTLHWLIFSILFNVHIQAQEYMPSPTDFDDLMETLLIQNSNQALNYTEIYETLFQYYQNPIHLNTCSEAQLNNLLLLTPSQSKAIVAHIQKYGTLRSIYELQAIDNIPIATIKQLALFVKIEEPISLQLHKKQLFSKGKHSFLCKTSSKLQDLPIASPYQMLRYRFTTAAKLSLGISLKNDFNEVFRWNIPKQSLAYDFYGMHVQLQEKGKLQNLIIGDFKAQFGQGLLFSSGFSIDKSSASITSIYKSNIGLRPYVSTVESGFFRGIANTIQVLKTISISTFVSSKAIDAKLVQDSSGNTLIASIAQTGLHETNSTWHQKASAKESNYGANMHWQQAHFSIGANMCYTLFSAPIAKPNALYQRYNFSGLTNVIGSMYYSYQWQNMVTFGELGRSKSGGNGFVWGIIAALSASFDLAMLYRKYDPQFQSFHGNAFGESSSNSNEEGGYIGIQYKCSSKINLSFYTDRFTSSWLNYQCDAPSKGNDQLLKITYSPQKNIQISTQMKQENKQKNSHLATETIHKLANTHKQQANVMVQFSPEKPWQFKTGILISSYAFENQHDKGSLVFQNIQLKKEGWSIDMRCTQFNIDSYEARLYVYENDLPATFSMPGFSGIGIRNYILLQLKILKQLNLSSKIIYSKTRDISTHTSTTILEIKLGLFGTF